MKCPRCGEELRRSKKDPNYGLCDSCRKKYKWVDEYDEDDYEEDEDYIERKPIKRKASNTKHRSKHKKNNKIIIGSITLAVFVLLIICIVIFVKGKHKNSEEKLPAQHGEETQQTPSENIVPQSAGTNENADPEGIRQKLDVKAIPTVDGLVCVFITNNSDTVIDELEVQLNYKDDSGATIDMGKDGHDMVLPGSTVVSRMDAPESYTDFEILTTIELGVHPKYENHANDVIVNSNQGDQGKIVEIVNNSDVSLDEVEFIAVLYKGEQITTVKYPQDIYDVPAGQTITEKINLYTDDYDRFEIYLNQAHTFGL